MSEKENVKERYWRFFRRYVCLQSQYVSVCSEGEQKGLLNMIRGRGVGASQLSSYLSLSCLGVSLSLFGNSSLSFSSSMDFEQGKRTSSSDC